MLTNKIFSFFVFRATPEANGGSQARGQIRAVAAGLHHSHSHSGSSHVCNLHHSSRQRGSPTHWVRSGIELASPWILVGFVYTVSQQISKICRTIINSYFWVASIPRTSKHIHWGGSEDPQCNFLRALPIFFFSLPHYVIFLFYIFGTHLWLCILCVNLIGLRDAQIAGKKYLSGCVCEYVCSRLWFSASIFNSAGGKHLSTKGLSRTKKAEEEQTPSLCFSWNIHLLLPSSDIGVPGS